MLIPPLCFKIINCINILEALICIYALFSLTNKINSNNNFGHIYFKNEHVEIIVKLKYCFRFFKLGHN